MRMVLERPASPRFSSIASTNSEIDFVCLPAISLRADQKASSNDIEVRCPFKVRDRFLGISCICKLLSCSGDVGLKVKN